MSRRLQIPKCAALIGPRLLPSSSDIAGVRKAMDAASHPALLFVDGVSSIGACDFRMDEWAVRPPTPMDSVVVCGRSTPASCC